MARVLIVDDKPANRQILTVLLEHAGHAAVEASDGAEALERARQEPPDLVITDILMPTMDGYEFVRQLRADRRLAQVPVIFYTAHYMQPEAKALAHACGVRRILYKPLDTTTVLGLVTEALSGEPPPAAPPPDFDRQHLALITDSLSRKNEQLRSTNLRMMTLVDFLRETALESDPHRILDLACRTTRELVGAGHAVIGITPEDGASFRYVATSGLEPAAAGRLRAMSPSEGVLARVLCGGAPVRMRDAADVLAAAGLPRYQENLRTLLAVPMGFTHFSLGWILLAGKLGTEEFSEEDAGMVASLTAHVRQAYENAVRRREAATHAARLEREIGQRRASEARLAILHEVTRTMAEEATLDEAAVSALRAACRMLGWGAGALWLVDREAGLLRCPTVWTRDADEREALWKQTQPLALAPGGGLPGRAWLDARPRWHSVPGDDQAPIEAGPRSLAGWRGAFAFPIWGGAEIIGVVELLNRDARTLDETLLPTFEALGDQIGLLVERRRAEQELLERAQITALSSDVGVAMTRPGSLRQRLQRCAEAFVKHLDAAFARVWTLDESGQTLELQASAGIYTHIDGPHGRVRVGELKIGLIAQEGRPHITNDVAGDPRISDRAWAVREGIVAFAGHPLVVQDRVVGVMALFARRRLSGFVLRGLETVADNVALGIENSRIEAEHQKLEAQFRQSQRIEAIGRLAGGVAHDFNNLLSVILGYGNMLMTRQGLSAADRKSVEEMCKAGERAAGLTRQLLAFSRKQVLVPETFDLRDVVKDVSKMLRRLIGEDVDLVLQQPEEPCRVRADRGQIEQVLMNLALNARDAMPHGGRLSVGVRGAEPELPAGGREDPAEAGRHVVLEVTDDGIGMDADVRSHVFEPFFTTKEPGKGTGLGLATVHGIVEQSGGRIDLESEPGRGSTFRIYLPRAGIEARPPAASRKAAGSAQGSETILLVEDEETVRKMAQQMLEQSGYRVLTAARGEEAERVARDYDGSIHLVLSDVVMPGLAAGELAARLLLLRPALKIVYMSGYSREVLEERGVPEELEDFLQKPFTLSALTRKVRDALDGVHREIGRAGGITAS